MEGIEELTRQVLLLKETMEALVNRQEQIFKLHDEKLISLEQSIQAAGLTLKEATDEIQVTDEALKGSLSDMDLQIDDLTKTVAALLMLLPASEREQIEAGQ